MGVVGRFAGWFDKYIVGYALGTAAGPSLEPPLQEVVNDLWSQFPDRPLPPDVAAALAVELPARDGEYETEASLSGTNGSRFDDFKEFVDTGPALGELLELWRRNVIGDVDVERGLRKLHLKGEWIEPLKVLKRVLLSPADLANARQQGFITDTDQRTRSNRLGVDDTDADLLFELAGLPPGVGTALELLRRGVIQEPEFEQMVREGHTKTKYTDELLELRWQLLSPAELANLAVRGWISLDTAKDRAEKLGIARDDFQLIFDGTGRPPGPGQLQTALNRGLIDRARFEHGIRESDVRPEWLDVEYGLRFRYPTLFQLSRLVSNGTLSPARALTILGYEGYEDQDAKALVDAWQAGKTAADKDLAKSEFLTLYEGRMIDSAQASAFLAGLGYDDNEVALLLELADARRVRKFLEAAIGKIHSLYIGHRLTRDQAVLELDSLGLTSSARDDNLALWDHEREVNLPVLTPTQLAMAVRHEAMTPQQAYDELRGRGYSDVNARRFLAGQGITL